VPLGSASSSLPWFCQSCFLIEQCTYGRSPFGLEVFLTHVWNSTTQDAEAVHDTIRAATSKVIAWVGFPDVSCHGTREVGIVRVGWRKVEVVDSRWVCGNVLVVELG